MNRRRFIGTAVGGVALGGASLSSLLAERAAGATPSPAELAAGSSLSDQLNEPGPEGRMLRQRVGLWDVSETFWAAPGAAPVTSTGLVAERVMIGTALQEFIRPPADSAGAAVKRTDLLCYNRLDGRWDYVSFDTRASVGFMPAWSLGRGDLDRIEISFAPFAVAGVGHGGTGQMLRMRQEIISEGADRDVKDQYFSLADGTGTEWLAHR